MGVVNGSIDYEAEGLSKCLIAIAAYTYNECPDARCMIADQIGLVNEDRRKIADMRENDPLDKPDWAKRCRMALSQIELEDGG